ncbi:MAG: hypothetical protein IPL78_25525 [Chloroflexi bacterium]|nr:hypothetical protein [Chloroflexota bacterium]
MDNTVNRIIDLEPETQTARSYVGNYSDYLEQFGQEKERQWDTYRDQELTIQRMQADISRTKEQARWVEVTTKPNNPGCGGMLKGGPQGQITREAAGTVSVRAGSPGETEARLATQGGF